MPVRGCPSGLDLDHPAMNPNTLAVVAEHRELSIEVEPAAHAVGQLAINFPEAAS